jgi:hypothetical protein
VKPLKKNYEAPDIYIEEFELENLVGNLCSGVDDIPSVWPGYPGPEPIE